MNRLKIERKRLLDKIKLIKKFLNDYLKEKKERVFKYIKGCHFFEKHSKLVIKILLLLILLFIYISIDSWEVMIFDYFKIDVNAISDMIVGNNIIDLTLSLLLLISIPIYFLYRVNDHRYWSNIKFIVLILSIYPLLSHNWSFTNSLIFPWLCYVKFSIYSIFFLEVIHSIFRIAVYFKRKNIKQNSAKGFIIDNPFDHKKDDVSGINREKFTQDIAARILNTDTNNNAFAVGITGVWGSGKSTFMDNLKNKLSSDSIIVEFSPWFSKTKDQVITDFFDTFKNKLSKYNPALSKQLTKYAKELSEIVDYSALKKAIKLLSIVDNSAELKEQYEIISSEIAKINKRVYVFIDDLDRLEKSEIMEVLKLIRNTANFKNTIFIVGYDREYIVKSIGSQGIINPEHYLEKIFSVEVSLPIYEKENLLIELKTKLEENLLAKNTSGIVKFISQKSLQTNDYLICQFLYNIRDVKRFVNLFSLSLNSFYPDNIKDVSPMELFIIELVRYRFFSTYLLLSENPKALLFYNNRDERYYIDEITITATGKSEQKPDEVFFGKLDTIFPDKYTIKEKTTLFEVLSFLFARESRNKKFSITYPHNYSRYFAFRIMNYNLSSIEFKNAQISIEEFDKFIDICIKDKKVIALLTMIETSDIPNLQIDNFKILFEGTFYLGTKTFIKIQNNKFRNQFLTATKTFFSIELVASDPAKKDYIISKIKTVSNTDEYLLFINLIRNLFVDSDEYDDYYKPDFLFNNDEIYDYIKLLFSKAITTCNSTSELFDGKSIYSKIMDSCIVSIFRYEENEDHNIVSKELIEFIQQQDDGSETLMKKFRIIDSFEDYEEENARKFHTDIRKYFDSKEKFKDLIKNCKDYNESKAQEYFEKMGIK